MRVAPPDLSTRAGSAAEIPIAASSTAPKLSASGWRRGCGGSAHFDPHESHRSQYAQRVSSSTDSVAYARTDTCFNPRLKGPP